MLSLYGHVNIANIKIVREWVVLQVSSDFLTYSFFLLIKLYFCINNLLLLEKNKLIDWSWEMEEMFQSEFSRTLSS